MITLNFDPTDILLWLFILSVLINVVLILALYRLANCFVLVSDVMKMMQPEYFGIWKKRFVETSNTEKQS